MKIKLDRRWLKHNRIFLLISLTIAIVMLYICYVMSNFPETFGDENLTFKEYRMLSERLLDSNRKQSIPDDILLVNVCYDRELVTVNDDENFECGNIDVTDRGKLLKFLELAKRKNNYRYILLDVFFSENYTTQNDSALFATIKSMDRIVIPRHSNKNLCDSTLIEKTALSDYTITIKENNFTKYEFFNSEYQPSIAMKMYQDSARAKIRNFGGEYGLYFMNGKLIRRSIILNFPIYFNSRISSEGKLNYYNLGSDILNIPNENIISELIKGKYIVIGDMLMNDIHSTIIGEVPGSLINLNAYQALKNGKQYVSLVFMGVLFFIFFIITYLSIKRISISRLLIRPQNRNSIAIKILLRIWHSSLVQFLYQFIVPIFTLALLLKVVSLLFFAMGESFEILILSSVFIIIVKIVKVCYTPNKQINLS